MMKKLVPNTIIPKSLYVDRVADEQLREIIHDMGRPGYILVARQMGKTNLLINAKRQLETPEDIFAYIDLSNRYDTDRECFRSIVDTILETNSDRLESIADEIFLDRESKSVAAHREHSREIRKILNTIKGKLIINLDEIDSLTTAGYSDKIFAHVRSVYFERINFKEYERLSYIISGVAEPSEIIKDKSISPFNIGQKILLGDFNYAEFDTFVGKADLRWAENIKKRIFYWCNGNPRLSWEICSFLEDMSVDGVQITESRVDETVKELYLTKFDRPPVDHIRALVEADKELREAVIAIIYEKSEALSDRIKSRLYLAGILGSDYEFGDVRIKNRIIEESLDEGWLSDLEKTDSLSINKAEDLFSARKYGDALEIYQYFAKQPELSSLEAKSINYKLGLCYFHTGKYTDAIACYRNYMYDKGGFRDLHMDQLYTLGMSYYQLNEDDDALKVFDEIIGDGDNPFYHEALMNKAAILVRSGGENERTEATKLNKMIIDMHEKGTQFENRVLSGAYYNVAVLNEAQNREIAIENYLKSARSADDVHKVTPLISAIHLQPIIIDDYLETIKELLSSGKIYLDAKEPKTGLELTHLKIASLISVLFMQGRTADIDSILEIVKSHCLHEKSTFAYILFEMALLNITSSETKEAIYLLQTAVSLSKEYSTPEQTFSCNKYLSFIDEDNLDSQEAYLKGFQNYVDVCDVVDVRLFERIISDYISQNDYQKAIGYCDLIVENEGLASKSNRVKFFTVLYLKMQATQNKTDLLEQARMIKEVADHIEEEKSNPLGLDDSMVKFIKSRAMQALVDQPIPQFIRSERKYGRNEKVRVRYEDGREETKKYKQVNECIKKGRCTIVH